MHDIGVLGMTRKSILKLRRTEKARDKIDKARRKAIAKTPDTQLQSMLVDKSPVQKQLEALESLSNNEQAQLNGKNNN